ncbi:carbon-nitrogen hydrolase family protein [Pikeienuella piscinae]|uniref:Carbon-nitrogen hydrolase family protein n=1 Tax=Pikeienuella piscinae TaxID=2748098 RepID=A0A7L5BT39_9RHOB|nr:carbon-nitrogen hydrolase family protein [Pikeienuella piscinae]QIE54990.1 carbon-nitrogen hydrolase family protein [Pikeienuella piscinae]
MKNDQHRIAVAQMHPVPDDVEGNLGKIERHVATAAEGGAALVIFPETATTGYFIADRLARLAEPADGPTATALGAIARRHAAHLAIGVPLAADDRVFDAQLLFGPDGALLATYRKAHLFAAERDWYAAGDSPMVVETALGRIGMSVCYDLIFPEYIRKLVDLGADLVINSTNWITDDFQRQTWGWDRTMVEALARTRALENGVWLAMTGSVGPEAGFDSVGGSCVVAPSGKIVASAGTSEGVAAADVAFESEELDRWRAIATYRADRRPDLY